MRGGPCLTERWWAKFEREPGTGCCVHGADALNEADRRPS